jgi:hypothetical protein
MGLNGKNKQNLPKILKCFGYMTVKKVFCARGKTVMMVISISTLTALTFS